MTGSGAMMPPAGVDDGRGNRSATRVFAGRDRYAGGGLGRVRLSGRRTGTPARRRVWTSLGARRTRPRADPLPEPSPWTPTYDEHRVFVIPQADRREVGRTVIDFKPGTRRWSHHVLAAFDTLSRARLDADDPSRATKVFGGFSIIPSGGGARRLGARGPSAAHAGRSAISQTRGRRALKVHYHKGGSPARPTRPGSALLRQGRSTKQLAGGMVTPRSVLFSRPPYASPRARRTTVTGTMTIRDDSRTSAVAPMHWLGKRLLAHRYRPTARRSPDPDRRLELQLAGTYDFVAVAYTEAAGVMLAHFDDNSARNL